MPQERPRESTMLLWYRPVPMIATPFGHSLHRSTHALPRCPDADRELPIAPSRTNVREAQEVEGQRLALALPSEICFGESPKGDQPRFLLVQFQTIFRKPLPQHPRHSFSVLAMLKADDEVVRVADEIHLPRIRGATTVSIHSSRT